MNEFEAAIEDIKVSESYEDDYINVHMSHYQTILTALRIANKVINGDKPTAKVAGYNPSEACYYNFKRGVDETIKWALENDPTTTD